MAEIEMPHPYRGQGMYQKCFSNTGDHIKPEIPKENIHALGSDPTQAGFISFKNAGDRNAAESTRVRKTTRAQNDYGVSHHSGYAQKPEKVIYVYTINY